MMDDWEPDDRTTMTAGPACLWIVPAQVGGNWTFRLRGAKSTFSVELEQHFQKLQGNSRGETLAHGKVSGNDVEFRFARSGQLTTVKGHIEGDRIVATVTRGGNTSDFVGTRT